MPPILCQYAPARTRWNKTLKILILTVNLEISVSARALSQLSNLHRAHLKYQMEEITRTLFYKYMENAPHYGLSWVNERDLYNMV